MARPTPTNPRQRRRLYWLNLTVMLFATMLIVVFANLIAADLPFRKDITHTRRYSLSDQTTKLLRSLDRDVVITSLYDRGSRTTQRVLDLLAEYQSTAADRVAVREIDPTLEPAQWREFTQDLQARFADEIDPRVAALSDAIQTVQAFGQFRNERAEILNRMPAEFRSALPRYGLPYDSLVALLTRSARGLEQLETQLRSDVPALGQAEEADNADAPILPDVGGAVEGTRQILQEISGTVLGPMSKDLGRLADRSDLPRPLREFMDAEQQAFSEMKKTIDQTLTRLADFETSEYARIRDRVLADNSLVIQVGDRMGVLTFDQVFTTVSRSAEGEQEPVARRLFRGEEAITGMIYTLRRETLPLIVFVNTTQAITLINGQGPYSHVAGALRNMNFRVAEWHVSGRQMMGGMLPPQPMPEPEAGQRVVLIVPPVQPPSPQMPINPGLPRLTDQLEKMLADDTDGRVMLFVNPTRITTLAKVEEPVLEPIRKLGIEPKTDRVVLRRQPVPAGEPIVTTLLEISDWPDASPITPALAGLKGLVSFGVPVTITDEAAEEWSTFPLIQSGSDSWAEVNPDNLRRETLGDDEDDQAGPHTIALGAARDHQRLIVIGDPYFIENRIALAQDGEQGNRFVRFPANTELFVNAVYWLGGLDELIAASPRSQDVPRIEPMSDGRLMTLQWLVVLGIPITALVAGAVVWAFRRT